MQRIRALDRVAKGFYIPTDEHREEYLLARELRGKRRRKELSAEDEAELALIRERTLGPLEEADAPPDPMDPFADEAANRLEQDLLMASNGHRKRAVLRRISQYKTFMNDPALQEKPVVQMSKEQVLILILIQILILILRQIQVVILIQILN